MRTTKIIRPVNSLILVCDQTGGVTPSWQRDKQILWTDSCVSVACYPEQDGPTKVTLGTADDVDPGSTAQFDGLLKIPTHVLSVQDIVHESFLTMNVSDPVVRIRVWLNCARWADRVTIGVY